MDLRRRVQAVVEQQALDLCRCGAKIEERLEITLVLLKIGPLRIELIEERVLSSRSKNPHIIERLLSHGQNRFAVSANAIGSAGISLINGRETVLQTQFRLL